MVVVAAAGIVAAAAAEEEEVADAAAVEAAGAAATGSHPIPLRKLTRQGRPRAAAPTVVLPRPMRPSASSGCVAARERIGIHPRCSRRPPAR